MADLYPAFVFRLLPLCHLLRYRASERATDRRLGSVGAVGSLPVGFWGSRRGGARPFSSAAAPTPVTLAPSLSRRPILLPDNTSVPFDSTVTAVRHVFHSERALQNPASADASGPLILKTKHICKRKELRLKYSRVSRCMLPVAETSNHATELHYGQDGYVLSICVILQKLY